MCFGTPDIPDPPPTPAEPTPEELAAESRDELEARMRRRAQMVGRNSLIIQPGNSGTPGGGLSIPTS